jgi:EmrB/QacA subfamily drug resistance transporter
MAPVASWTEERFLRRGKAPPSGALASEREDTAPRRGAGNTVIQYALLAGPLLSMLDSSIVNVAVAPIGRDLHAGLPVVQWAVSGYLLALGTGLAATAYLSRRFGTLAVYRASVVAFTLASAACAAAPGVRVLIAARILQGLVAAPLVPLAMSMLFGGSDATRSMPATAGLLLFLGPALGPSVGGALIGAVGWRSIFLVNVPFGIAAAIAVGRIPADMAAPRTERARLDLPGLLLLASGLALLLFGISQAPAAGWGSAGPVLGLTAGAVLLAGYAVRAGRTEQPVLDLALARSRTGAVALMLCAAASVVTFTAVFLLPVFLQETQGHTALAAGLALLPQGLITGLSTTLGQRVLRFVTVRTTVLAGFAVLTAASLGLLAITARTPLPVTSALLAARSAAIGLVITPLLAVISEPLSPGELGDASTLFSIWQRIAGSLGIGVLAAVYAQQSAAHGAVTALHVVGILIAAIAAVGLLAAALLPARRNVAVYGR